MKRVIVLVACLLFGAAVAVGAQETPIAKAEADYRFQFDLYRTAYQSYQVNKAEYLKSGTLKAEQEALEAAKEASLARADVLRTHTQWLRLQLLETSPIYLRSSELADRLDQLSQSYLADKSKINAAGDKTEFESVQAEYTTALPQRERLIAQSQIELKLAKLALFREEIMRLYEPLIPILTTHQQIPEVEQGMTRVATNFDDLNARIQTLSENAKVLESTDIRTTRNDPATVNRTTTKELESLRQLILNTISILSELEARYGQP